MILLQVQSARRKWNFDRDSSADTTFSQTLRDIYNEQVSAPAPHTAALNPREADTAPRHPAPLIYQGEDTQPGDTARLLAAGIQVIDGVQYVDGVAIKQEDTDA